MESTAWVRVKGRLGLEGMGVPEKGPLGAGAGLLTGVHGATWLGLG